MLYALRYLVLAVAAALLTACSSAAGEQVRDLRQDGPAPAATFTFRADTPTPTPSPSPTPTPSPTPSPTPAPTRTPPAAPAPQPVEPARGAALVIGDGVLVRSMPSTTEGQVVRRLGHLQEIQVLGAVRGERWIVGDQTWPMAQQSWTDTWYRVDGGYVYSAYVFIPRAGETSPFVRGAKRIEVDVRAQKLSVLVGEQVVWTAPVTTGKPGYETPPGRYTVGAWGRVANETMTSSQAAINDPAEQYHVKNVLYTQYFDGAGDALHLNYWQPESVFGAARTSHGCVGLQIHDAQWLWLFAAGGVRLDIQ